MIDIHRSNNEWLTLQDAAVITGKSVTALRMLIKRKKIDQVKKIPGKRGDYWVIKKDSLMEISDQNRNFENPDRNSAKVITLPVEVYMEQQKERDQALQGLMMYRYKFEEAEKQLLLLPGAAHQVSSRIEELERRLREQSAELEQARRPWWKKLMGLK